MHLNNKFNIIIPELKKEFSKEAKDITTQFVFEMGMELLKPAINNHKEELDELLIKRIDGLATNKEIFDRLIELKKQV